MLVGRSYLALCRDLDINPHDVLRHAGLSEEQFLGEQARLSLAEYLGFWRSLEQVAQDPELGLTIANRMRLVPFDPCTFAGLCSPNLVTGAHRIAQYKRLVGPLRMDVCEGPEGLRITVEWVEAGLDVPRTLSAMPLIYLVRIAREATRHHIRPLRLTSPQPRGPNPGHAEFFGITPEPGPLHSLLFSTTDARRVFLTANEALWSSFEPELQRRLSKLDQATSTSERLRSALLESLPSGETSVALVARRLGLSARTLQRRLHAEGQSFKGVLSATREKLSRHYVKNTDLSYAQIAFLIGFEETSSFFRAFRGWTGQTPAGVRRRAKVAPASIPSLGPHPPLATSTTAST